MKKVFLGMLVWMLWATVAQAQESAPESKVSVTVKIQDIANDEGVAKVEIVDEKNKRVAADNLAVKLGEAQVTFADLAPGKYAVRFFHDANRNEQLDKNKMGFPTEGYGFSNNVGVFGPPKFKDLLFEVASGNTEVKIKAVYH